MLQRPRLLAALLVLLFTIPAYAAVSPLPFCQEQTGPETNGSVYLICPAANPNADLVIFAHGFISPDEPVGIPYNQLVLPDGTSIPGLIAQLGMSFAATSYPVNGLAIVEGVDSVKDVATYFKNHYGSPNRILLTGVSEGGLVVAKAIESAPGDFSGGLAACGPVGDFRYQISYFMDVRVIFDYFFPGVIPGSAIDVPDNVRLNFTACTTGGCIVPYGAQVYAALVTNPAKTAQLLKVTGVPTGPDPAKSIIDVLWYNVTASKDAIAKLGGNPYDNRFRLYFGSSNDLLLNLKVHRFSADAAALQAIAAGYQTTGKLKIPLVTLHTTGDNVVPFVHELLYGGKVALNGSLGNYIGLPVVRYGHCNFTATDAVIGLGALLAKTH
jgi:hypothetical protein